MSNNNVIPNSGFLQGSARVDQNAKHVMIGYKNGTAEVVPIPMTADGKILIEVIPVSNTVAATDRAKLDENSRWTLFGLSSVDDAQVPITMTNLGGTAPAVRIDLTVLP